MTIGTIINIVYISSITIILCTIAFFLTNKKNTKFIKILNYISTGFFYAGSIVFISSTLSFLILIGEKI